MDSFKIFKKQIQNNLTYRTYILQIDDISNSDTSTMREVSYLEKKINRLIILNKNKNKTTKYIFTHTNILTLSNHMSNTKECRD